MQVEKQTAALRDAISRPLMRAADLLKKDIHDHDDELDEEGARAPMIYLGAEGAPHHSSSASASRRASRAAPPSRRASLPHGDDRPPPTGSGGGYEKL
ncbi:hypothetical protein MNEG_15242 [Monoraphidium neglectum]|uniref:Uncharacterized protein n=1 Tax=Monoraphidium neglectum TaxID=145388 RepID=A0A0D2LSG5_9CHLO|nr:hypothetical protein MNEG_15242 [Monoraphidium neglectum]KIY92721.1 hypothetical protein MNEG_15242 [Monoraphidium neglectum]|eukprot:XP_013891741.1 hypothetical protein MNEG_15242 [Monoraphidium neglectum]